MKIANQLARSKRLIKLAGALLCAAAVYASCDASAGALTVLQSFGQTSQGGYIPQNIAMGPDGALYGTTNGGGAKGDGTVYRLTRKSGKWTEDVLYSFGARKNDGNALNGIVVTSDGAIFGTTQSGGKFSGGGCSAAGCGTVFEVSSKNGKTWKETILHDFKGFPTDGATPRAGLLADEADTVNGFPTFYGTTTIGGSGNDDAICGEGQGCGTLYRLTLEKSGWKVRVLQSFKGTNGFSPETAPTIDSSGALYISTPLGGTSGSNARSFAGNGIDTRFIQFGKIIFLATAAAESPTIAPTPVGSSGGKDAHVKPATSVIGTSYGGGVADGCTSNNVNGCGTVYLLTEKTNPKAQWKLQFVHKFKGDKDGAGPMAGLTLDTKTGVYYGVTSGEESPSKDVGTIFALTPSNKSATGYEYSVLFRFDGKNGGYPRSNLIISNGVLYGTTGGGGKYAFGTVFSFKP